MVDERYVSNHTDPKYLYEKYLGETAGPRSYWEIWCAAIDANAELLNAIRAHRDNLMKMVGSPTNGGVSIPREGDVCVLCGRTWGEMNNSDGVYHLCCIKRPTSDRGAE